MKMEPTHNKPAFLDQPQQKTDIPFAEVMSSTLLSATAQCWQWNTPPTFGSLVWITNAPYSFLGIVTTITTAPADSFRTPIAYQKTPEQLQREQPQIFEFLATTFTIHVMGYQTENNSTILFRTPPRPSAIHAFVSTIDHHQALQIITNNLFLTNLIAHGHIIENLDDVLLATLHDTTQAIPCALEQLKDVGLQYAQFMASDYRRTKRFLQCFEHLLESTQ